MYSTQHATPPFTHPLSVRRASRLFRIPRTTLDRYSAVIKFTSEMTLEYISVEVERCVFSSRRTHAKVKERLSAEEESLLIAWIVTHQSVGRSVGDYAVEEKVKQIIAAHGDIDVSVVTLGQNWMSRFMDKYPTLVYRSPTNMVMAKAMSVSNDSLSAWYALIGPVIFKYMHDPKRIRICALDETGICGTVVERMKVIAARKAEKLKQKRLNAAKRARKKRRLAAIKQNETQHPNRRSQPLQS
jgi:hypothetical protein